VGIVPGFDAFESRLGSPAAGVYDRGNDKDLGGSIQFRSGLELAYEMNPGSRVGAVFYHLSNAGLEPNNPGSESLVVFWSWR